MTITRSTPRPIDELERTTGAGTAVRAAVGPLRYNPITPYRALATPELGPSFKIPSGYFLTWDVWRDVSRAQQIPSTVLAVTFNLTITQTVGAAFLAILPSGGSYAGVSTINWMRSNTDLANNGTVGVGADANGFPGCIVLACGGTGAATHALLDVTGYYL